VYVCVKMENIGFARLPTSLQFDNMTGALIAEQTASEPTLQRCHIRSILKRTKMSWIRFGLISISGLDGGDRYAGKKRAAEAN
jgi:hypothetical protein